MNYTIDVEGDKISITEWEIERRNIYNLIGQHDVEMNENIEAALDHLFVLMRYKPKP